MQYCVTEADWVNDLLFELLTRQLSQLGHREVILEENDCRLLLKNLNLQAAADCKTDDADRNSFSFVYRGFGLVSRSIRFFQGTWRRSPMSSGPLESLTDAGMTPS